MMSPLLFPRQCRQLLAGVLALGTAALLSMAVSGAQAGKDPKETDVQLHGSLRNVINQGADLYNVAQDYGGSYYTFKGSLVAIRPLLSHHPELQKLIDQSVAAAETEPRMWQRALTLRSTLESIRTKIDPNPGKTTEEKGKDKKVDEKKDDGMARVYGTVTFKGQPVSAGFVTFIAKDGRTYSANLSPKGTYSLKKFGMPPGEYVVIIDPPVSGDLKAGLVPARYRARETSPVRLELQRGEEKHDLPLD